MDASDAITNCSMEADTAVEAATSEQTPQVARQGIPLLSLETKERMLWEVKRCALWLHPHASEQ